MTGGRRIALPRQQVLRATVDRSYRRLSDAQRRLLQRLSVFAGGCTLQAAEASWADSLPGGGLDTGPVLENLAALMTKSMVNADHAPKGAPRYQLPETVREYAREKLHEAANTISRLVR